MSALVNGAIAKVKCRTCGHFQDYKPPKPVADRRARLVKKAMRLAEQRTGSAPQVGDDASRRAPDLSPAQVLRRMWDEATQDVHPLKVAVYSPNKTFKERDIMTHSKFGMGVVQEVVDGEVVVLFREGFERLEHGRP